VGRALQARLVHSVFFHKLFGMLEIIIKDSFWLQFKSFTDDDSLDSESSKILFSPLRMFEPEFI